MSIPGSAEPLLLAQQDTGGYQIQRSLRFSSNDSAYLSRTPASAGNRKTWTWAGWVKRSALPGGNGACLFSGGSNNTVGMRIVYNDERLLFDDSSISLSLQTSALYRDLSAWYHVLVAWDSTQATSSNRAKIYVNGEQVTQFASAGYPAQNSDGQINGATAHSIGREQARAAVYFDGLLADIHFIDGQALTPSSFTEVSATTGQLIPKQYTGSFGTNGFWLKFSDNSAATATTLGKDYSGNSNNWTPNNLSVTAGAGNDSLVDTPSSAGTDTGLGGQVTGNYATLNPLFNSYPNLSNGNLDSGPWSDNGWNRNVSSIVVNTGKWYFEANIGNATDGSFRNGIGIQINPVSTSASKYLGDSSDSYGGLAKSAGITGYTNAGAGTSLSNALSSGSILRCAVDVDAGKVWIGDSTAYIGGGSPASGTSPTYTFTANSNVALGVSTWGGGDVTSVNYGQRAFSATAPSGFKALCDTNLPAPVVAKSASAFDVKLYTGNNSTQTISGLGFSPDFIWTKSRSRIDNNVLHDIVRGRTSNLYSDLDASENTTTTSTADLVSFDANGYTLGTVQQSAMNRSGETYVAWAWDAGSSTVTNTQGSITSSCRTNQSSGFSIATFTAPSSGSATIGHGLGVEPQMIIIKSRDQAYNWCVYHKALTSNAYFLNLNTTAAQSNTSNIWNNTTPTSTVFSLGSGYAGAGATVAYLFSPVAGYSSFGSYTGGTQGTFVYLGFTPKWLLVKSATGSVGDNWKIYDSSRSPYNVRSDFLAPNTSGAEVTANLNQFDFVSNGFVVRTNPAYDTNFASTTYIYAAFAENPFQYARAR